MICKNKIGIFLILSFPFFSHAQNLTYDGSFSAVGLAFSDEESPFWLHSNKRGRVNETSNLSGVLSGRAVYNLTSTASISIGGGVLYQDGYVDDVQLDESFLSFSNGWLTAYVGRKQREELYKGLSATNENILFSLNARPLPGISFRTNRPLYFWKSAGLGVEAGLEEFFTDDERYVKDTRIHHKFVSLIFSGIPNYQFKVGMQHFVQWGGTSPDFGPLPDGFKDYLQVISGRGVGEEVGGGNEVNGLGNHLGSYELGVKTSTNQFNIELIYNHLFEDGSGMRLGNTPDGRYGIFISDKEPGKWMDAFMYELYYTKHQSRTSSGTDGADNYFNNNLYRSGWTYHNRILGVPFIYLDEDRFRVANNIVLAHHVGIAGNFVDYPYTILASYRKNYGAKQGGQINNSILSTFLNLKVYQDIVDIDVEFGADFHSLKSPNFGAGLQVSKRFF